MKVKKMKAEEICSHTGGKCGNIGPYNRRSTLNIKKWLLDSEMKGAMPFDLQRLNKDGLKRVSDLADAHEAVLKAVVETSGTNGICGECTKGINEIYSVVTDAADTITEIEGEIARANNGIGQTEITD